MRYFKYIYVVVAFSWLTSCKKSFFDVFSNDNVVRQQYVTNIKGAQEFLNGAYISLSRDFYAASLVAYPELVADNLKQSASSPTVYIRQYYWDQYANGNISNDENFDNFWKLGYHLTRSCSYII